MAERLTMTPPRIPPAPSQESVWDYPRPAIAEQTSALLQVRFDGRLIAETRSGVRTLETSHPPSYYFPRSDVDMEALRLTPHRTHCEWKGKAEYFDLVSGYRVSADACWSYPCPTHTFATIAGLSRSIRASWMRVSSMAKKSRLNPGLLRRMDHVSGGWSVQGRARPQFW